MIIDKFLVDIAAVKCAHLRAVGHNTADSWLLKDGTEANEVMESGVW